jgi:GTPase SAR1 family protein
MTQEQALNILKMGHNVYLTGPAGSGKTFVLNKYIYYLKSRGVEVGITASTGIAATHIGGVTIHSWSGLGIKNTLNEYDLEALQDKQYLWKRFEKVKTLIIDEVSMLHHFRLDLVEKVCRTFKRNEKPFGGIQVILCGDFFQLPPISGSYEEQGQFVYHSRAWSEADFKICYLEEQHRQTDNSTISILNEIRENKVSQKNIDLLKSKIKGPHTEADGAFSPTRLYTHNIDVENINQKELAQIKEEEKVFEMIGRGGNDVLIDLLKKSCLAPDKIKLKVGAKVMFVKNNFEVGYVNGTLGTVIALGRSGPTVRTFIGQIIDVEPASWKIEEDGKVKAEIVQYPLRLAWAITVHKSQGMSLDYVEVDLSKSFERGMGYVALSRVRSIDGLRIIGFNDMALKVSDEIVAFDRELRDLSIDAVADLVNLDKNELHKVQVDFLKKIGANNLDPNENIKGTGQGSSKNKTGGSARAKLSKSSTYDLTKEMILEGRTITEISRLRNLKPETVIDHCEHVLMQDNLFDFNSVYKTVSLGRTLKIIDAFKKAFKIKSFNDFEWKVDSDKKTSKSTSGTSLLSALPLSPVKHILDQSFNYLDIRIVRMKLFQESRMI